MISVPVSQPGLNTRVDSPMQSSLQTSTESPTGGNKVTGLPTPANDVPTSGFTAVNGDGHRHTSFRPIEPGPPQLSLTTKDHHIITGAGPTPVQSAYSAHNWRPDESQISQNEANQPDVPNTTKRKRIDSASDDENHKDVTGADSPKRRMTTLNSGPIPPPNQNNQTRTSSSDGREGDLAPATTGAYIREPSPVARWNRGEPPPPPRPEVEAGLAASLQQTLGDGEHQQLSQQPITSTSASPQVDSHEGQRSQEYSPDPAQAQAQHEDELRRERLRKRNFSTRTKTGCHTCRQRKKKCDEAKPVCENCKRGNFPCGGYGPKPPGGAKINAARPVVPLQAKHNYEQPAYGAPPPLYDHGHYPRHPPWDQPRSDTYAQPPHRYDYPSAIDRRPPAAHSSWDTRAPWSGPESALYLSERLPPVEHSGIPPPPPPGYPHDPHPPPDAWARPGSRSQYQPPPAPPTVISSRESVATSHSSGHPPPPSLGYPLTEAMQVRMKMWTGQPHDHYINGKLIDDRESCNRAVESYNYFTSALQSAYHGRPTDDLKAEHFLRIIHPTRRDCPGDRDVSWKGVSGGSIGTRTLVETPFSCEFGYNIHLGDRIVIGANCRMQDACRISIGNRTIVGENVKFYCVTASVDAKVRGGVLGDFIAGAIIVEEDCFIGANVTIMPFRTIGKGAVVGAGSVVTRVSV